jgi:hypothetical protein
MPGEGFIMDAIRSLKNNKRSRVSKTGHLGQKSIPETPFVDKNKATKSDLEKIRRKIQSQEFDDKKRMIKNLILAFLMVIIVFLTIEHFWMEILNFLSFQ